MRAPAATATAAIARTTTTPCHAWPLSKPRRTSHSTGHCLLRTSARHVLLCLTYMGANCAGASAVVNTPSPRWRSNDSFDDGPTKPGSGRKWFGKKKIAVETVSRTDEGAPSSLFYRESTETPAAELKRRRERKLKPRRSFSPSLTGGARVRQAGSCERKTPRPKPPP